MSDLPRIGTLVDSLPDGLCHAFHIGSPQKLAVLAGDQVIIDALGRSERPTKRLVSAPVIQLFPYSKNGNLAWEDRRNVVVARPRSGLPIVGWLRVVLRGGLRGVSWRHGDLA